MTIYFLRKHSSLCSGKHRERSDKNRAPAFWELNEVREAVMQKGPANHYEP